MKRKYLRKRNGQYHKFLNATRCYSGGDVICCLQIVEAYNMWEEAINNWDEHLERNKDTAFQMKYYKSSRKSIDKHRVNLKKTKHKISRSLNKLL